VWDPATGQHRKTLTGHSGGVTAVAISPDGRQIASGSSDKTVRVWDAATGKHRKTLTGHSDRVNAVAFSPDGRQIASSSDSSICINTTPSLKSRSYIGRFVPAWSKHVLKVERPTSQLRFSRNGRFLLTEQRSYAIEESTQDNQHTSAEDQEVNSLDVIGLFVSSEGIKFNNRLVLSCSGIQMSCTNTLDDQLVLGFADGSVLSFVIDRATLSMID
jgi:WD40 repeat protein